MDKATVIALARQAGWQYADGDTGYDPLWRFAALIEEHLTYATTHSCHPGCTKPPCVAMREAVEAEREACAKVCEELRLSRNTDWESGTLDCAAAIRSRK